MSVAVATTAPPLAEAGQRICHALRAQVEKLGLSIGDEPHWEKLDFAEKRDPFSQEISLVGVWRGGARYGEVTFFPDGRVFAEYQVLLPHPDQITHYVELVRVWGTPARLAGEAVVVPLPGGA